MAGSRHRLLPGRGGEAVRDLDRFARSQIPLSIVTVVDTYKEPMLLAFPRKPAGVLLIELQEAGAPETPVTGWALVHTTYTQQGIRINEIEGPLVGERYRFSFLVIG